jgi:glutaredoxin 3
MFLLEQVANVSSAVRVYVAGFCPYCFRVKALLKKRGIAFDEIDLTHDAEGRAALVRRTGRRTVPQVFIGDASIGGFDELHALDDSGELQRMLAAATPMARERA